MQDFTRFGGDFVDALDADDEGKLWLGRDVEGAVLLAQARQTDLLTLGIAVFFDVGFRALEDDTAFFLVGLLSLLGLSSTFLARFLLALALLEKGLRDKDLILGRDASILPEATRSA